MCSRPDSNVLTVWMLWSGCSSAHYQCKSVLGYRHFSITNEIGCRKTPFEKKPHLTRMCLNTSGLFQICHLCPNSLRNSFLNNFSVISTTTIFGTPSIQLIALLRVLNDLLTASDSGSISILTLLDLSAAFDTIDHTILLTRFESTFGIRDLALFFFRSYLQDRTQVVTVNGIKSSP